MHQFFCFADPFTIVTLHQSQGHWNEHDHGIYNYHHAKFECNSINTAQDMAIIVQVKLVKFEMHGDIE